MNMGITALEFFTLRRGSAARFRILSTSRHLHRPILTDAGDLRDHIRSLHFVQLIPRSMGGIQKRHTDKGTVYEAIESEACCHVP